MEDYSNYIKVDGCSVKLISTKIVADSIKRMRVRQGKAGPNGKPKTDLMLLARAETTYSFGHVDTLKKNEGFNKFMNKQVAVIHAHDTIIWSYEPKIKYHVMTEPDEKGNALLKCEQQPKLSGVYYLIDPEIIVEDSHEKKWAHTGKVQPVKQLSKVATIGFATESILNTVNSLLRQALLFKGVNFAKVEEEVKVAGKPVTYLLNTVIELDTGEKDSAGRSMMRRIKLHKCTVRKTFRQRESIMGMPEDRCGILFDGKTCKPITIWLQSLNLYF
jgi:hypothetical protein